MANLFRRFRLLSVVLLSASSVAMGQDDGPPAPISLDATSSSFDRKTNRVSFTGLRITQGELVIEADRALATGLDFAGESRWEFSGDVAINMESARIRADTAEFTFESHQLVSGELSGDPVQFEDYSTTRAQAITGGARRLTYRGEERTLRFFENAWLSEGPNRIEGCDLIYDMAEERVTSGSSDCGEPVRITIQPPNGGAGTSTPETP